MVSVSGCLLVAWMIVGQRVEQASLPILDNSKVDNHQILRASVSKRREMRNQFLMN